MISVEQAWEKIQEVVEPGIVVTVNTQDALGCVLAEDIGCVENVPPFTKSLMDGFALRTADFSAGMTEFEVLEVITAGTLPQLAITTGKAAQIMTGAMLPAGADAVVRIEETAFDASAKLVRIHSKAVRAGQDLLPLGAIMQPGDIAIPAGTLLHAPQIGALAELGITQVSVRAQPQVAILATGDELVSMQELPEAGQIRNSNEPMLCAQMKLTGAIPVPLGIAKDNREELHDKVLSGLACNILILSGGVSAGKLDLVPSELARAGVQQVFHQIALKPGKPLWFGVWQHHATGRKCYVFGLPGNPVSSLVCCELFVQTAIRRLRGVTHELPVYLLGNLQTEFLKARDRLTYHPGYVTLTEHGYQVKLLPWQGSSDLQATVSMNALVQLNIGTQPYQSGDQVRFLPFGL